VLETSGYTRVLAKEYSSWREEIQRWKDMQVPCSIAPRRKGGARHSGPMRREKKKKLAKKWGHFVLPLRGNLSLDHASRNHDHRAEDDLPRRVGRRPEAAVENAWGKCVAPDSLGRAGKRHRGTHSVARGGREEEGSDLASADVDEGAAGCNRAHAGASEYRVVLRGARAYELVQPVRDEEGVQRGRENASA
jgi:hypothetical protein